MSLTEETSFSENQVRCGLYCRISVDKRKGLSTETSTELQKQKLLHYVQSQENWITVRVYEDGDDTGANLCRGALQEMLTIYCSYFIHLDLNRLIG